MLRFILFVVSIFLFSVMSQAQPSDLFDKLLYVSKKDTLPYRLLKPVNPGVKDSYPLIIFLHGAGECGRDNEVQTKFISDLVLDPKYRGKYPCYVLAPQCPKKQGWANQDEDGTIRKEPSPSMKMVIELIDKVTAEFPVDESRIYVIGLSMGGFGTWDLLARFPDKFAAAVPICGGGDEKTASKIKTIPLWAFHGSLDNVVSPKQSRTMIKALQDAGGKPGYTEYPDVDHASWVHAFKEPHLPHWLFKQKLAGKSEN